MERELRCIQDLYSLCTMSLSVYVSNKVGLNINLVGFRESFMAVGYIHVAGELGVFWFKNLVIRLLGRSICRLMIEL